MFGGFWTIGTDAVCFGPFQVSDQVHTEAFRERLRKMTDAKLLRFGRGNRYMCSPYANLGKSPLEPFVIQLREARAEWRRRHPKT